jgi:dihydrofolate reductase
MTSVISNLSISLDGYVAGPNQSIDNPLGEQGLRLHEWMFASAGFYRLFDEEGGEESPDSDLITRDWNRIGAHIMGRNMFAPGRGEWDMEWRGWWGEVPPYHAPVFVLSHYPREPLPMDGGTTFTFVTGGIDDALKRARAAAGERDVSIGGGASTVRQYLKAGLIDELTLHIVPITLGAGERLFDDVGDVKLRPTEVLASPAVTHIAYRPD